MCNYSQCKLNTELVPELSMFSREKSGFLKCLTCKRLADELAGTGPLVAAGRTASSYCSRVCFKKAWKSQEHVCETELSLTGLLKEFRALICSEPLLTVGEEKVIMVVVHSPLHRYANLTFDIERIRLSVDCLPAACPNLRKAVVQQDLCTGNECLLLLKWEKGDRILVQSLVCESVNEDWFRLIVTYMTEHDWLMTAV